MAARVEATDFLAARIIFLKEVVRDDLIYEGRANATDAAAGNKKNTSAARGTDFCRSADKQLERIYRRGSTIQSKLESSIYSGRKKTARATDFLAAGKLSERIYRRKPAIQKTTEVSG